MSSSRQKVVVAMSGGVDSSVAAALLVRQGYEVTGAFMRLGTPAGVENSEAEACDSSHSGKQGCCSVLDAADARKVAGVLGISLYVLNFQEDFSKVIDYFLAEYNRGRTPNPCVRCNDWLKFGKLAQYAQAIGADYVASGHYARVVAEAPGAPHRLLRGLDHQKDQSYVLFGLRQTILDRLLLPIGQMEKPQVRALAQEMNLPVHNKPDSQEICFVPDQDYPAMLRRRDPGAFRPGEIVDQQGHVVGRHEGHQHFTIGQRRGVGVALGYPIYVVSIDPASNRVVVGDQAALLKTTLIATQFNWSGQAAPAVMVQVRCTAKIRYNHQPQPAAATVLADGQVHVCFDRPQSAITPGQAVVLYDGEYVLGGGWIDGVTG